MQLAVISDTHMPRGSRRIPEACVARLRSADAILHAGDLADVEVLDYLEALGPPVHAIRGNVDSAELALRLPAVRTVRADGLPIGMVHDAGAAGGRLERMRRMFPEAAAVVFGHSHLPLHEEADGFQIFNPGSPTERRSAPVHTMGVATVADGAVAFELIELD